MATKKKKTVGPWKGSYHREAKMYSRYGGSSSKAVKQKVAWLEDKHPNHAVISHSPKGQGEYPNSHLFEVDHWHRKTTYYNADTMKRHTEPKLKAIEKANKPKRRVFRKKKK